MDSIIRMAQRRTESNQVATEAQPTEQTLSIWSLLTSGGIGGQIIMKRMVISL